REENFSELLEPMSGGSVSIGKAGIFATLPARTSILAAANPKMGSFDIDQPLARQIAVPSPILNRFDLVFVMLDKPDKDFDEKSISHVFGKHIGQESDKEFISPQLFRKYIHYCRGFNPKLTEEIKKPLIDFYKNLRQQSSLNGIK
ncbi:MAG: minichromosome maintenance protein MCM, partial [Candidatus Nanoarchaeia archaeon]